MTLTFTQGLRVMGRLELSCMKHLMFVMVDYVTEMTVKKSCKCHEYGSFEQMSICSSCFMYLLFYMSNIWIYVICCVHLASWLVIFYFFLVYPSVSQPIVCCKTFMFDNTRQLFNQILSMHHWPLPSETAFSDLDLA